MAVRISNAGEGARSPSMAPHVKVQFWTTVIPVAIQGAIARSCGM